MTAETDSGLIPRVGKSLCHGFWCCWFLYQNRQTGTVVFANPAHPSLLATLSVAAAQQQQQQQQQQCRRRANIDIIPELGLDDMTDSRMADTEATAKLNLETVGLGRNFPGDVSNGEGDSLTLEMQGLEQELETKLQDAAHAEMREQEARQSGDKDGIITALERGKALISEIADLNARIGALKELF